MMPIDYGLDHKTKDDQIDTYQDPDVQVPELSKISHKLLHPFLHLTDSRRFVACMCGKLVVLEYVPIRKNVNR